jgi:Flp pilus assembly protein TadD
MRNAFQGNQERITVSVGKKSRVRKANTPAGVTSAESTGLIQLIGQLMENRQYQEALRAAATLVEHDPLNPSAHGILGSMMLQFGEPFDAYRHFEMAVRLGANRDPDLYRGMAVSASMARLPITARRSAQLGILMPTMSDENRAVFTSVVESTDTYLSQLVGTSGIEQAVAERAMLLVEGASRAIQAEDTDRARQRSLEATQAAPQLPPVWNNLAALHWSLGEVDEALAATDAGLAAVADPASLLSTVCRMHAFMGREEQARTALAQLQALPSDQTQQNMNLAQAYAPLDDDQGVFDTLAAFPDRENNPVARFMFGVAAANLGRREEARQAWRNLGRDGMQQAQSFSELMARNEKPATPDGRYPYYSATEMVPGTVLAGLFAAVQENSDLDRIDDAAARFPKLPTAVCESLILQAIDPRVTVELLLRLPGPGMAEALARFSTGRSNDQYDRLYAAIALRGAGLEAPGTPASVWLGGKRQALDLPALRLSVLASPTYAENVGALMHQATEAQEQNNPARAAELYAQVLALNATLPEAEHNLGTALLLSNRLEEGEAHVRRSLELEDNYALARCNLASLELSRGKVEEAARFLEPLDARTAFTLEEVVAYLRTRSDVAHAQGDPARAELLLHCLLAFDHDNALALERLKTLTAMPTAG